MNMTMNNKLKQTVLLLVAVFSALSGTVARAQEASVLDREVTIKVKDMPVDAFLAEMERKGNCQFFYGNAVIAGIPPVTVDVIDMKISAVLDAVLKGTGCTYELIADSIAIKKAEVPDDTGKSSGGLPEEFILSGKVVDENSAPLSGVGVFVLNTTNGVLSDADGAYSLKVRRGDVVQFSFLGYKTQNVTVGTETGVDIKMLPEAEVLNSVVVTALGIKRDEKSLGYAMSKINSEAISNATTANNWLSGLNGQVAGLRIEQSSSGGGTTRVTLRGESSVDFANNGALFVVDGVPMYNNSTASEAGGQGSAYAIDYGDGSGDINPDDIESVTVLKGPAATALYGSSASNGAIIITTKSAESLESKVSVEFSAALSFETVNSSPDLQYEYGQGDEQSYFYYVADTSDPNLNPLGKPGQSGMLSWGAKLDGTPAYQYYNIAKGIGGSLNEAGDFIREQTPFVSNGDWFRDFFETGNTLKNSLTVSGRLNSRNYVRLSFSDMRQQGIIPNSPGNNQHLFLRTKNEFTKWFTSEITLNYRRKQMDNIPTGSGYGSTSIMYSLWCYAPNINMDWAKNYWADGQEGKQQDTSLTGGKNNAYFIANECVNTQDRDRIYGNVKLDFDIWKGLKLMLRGGLDHVKEFRTQQQAVSTQAKPEGWYQEQHIASLQYTGEFLLTYNRKFDHDFGLNANLGGSILYREYSRTQQTADNLYIPGVYSLANSKSEVKNVSYSESRQTNSLYGLVSLSWRNAVFLDLTGRNDWASTLPPSNRSFFYPSVSGSVVLNELLDFGRTNGAVDFMKIRASWAQVGHDTAPYRIEEYFQSTKFPSGVIAQPTKANSALKPEIVSSWEVGADIRLFRSRLNLDLAYYDGNTRNILAKMPVSTSTGVNTVFTNAGTIRNRGVEISVSGLLLKTKDFSWRLSGNWSMNRNEVLKLGDGIDFWNIAQYSSYAYMYAYVGSSLTSMYGYKYRRAPEGSYAVGADGKMTDVSGMMVLDKNGSPITDYDLSYIGECMPKWQGGFSTQFSWKGLKASISFDGQYGGHVWSLTNWVLNYRGKGTATLAGRDGLMVPKGVQLLEDGNYRIYTGKIPAGGIQAYYQALYDRPCTESNFVSTSFLKLREVRLEYSFPKKLLAKTKVINGLTLAAYGNNLYCWSRFPGFDPESVTMRGNALTPGFDLLQMPSTAQYGASIKITF